jgi:hypothetical protein
MMENRPASGLGISHQEYVDDQGNAKRQSGTTKGKRAVKAFLKSLDERFSDGSIGSADWNGGLPALRSAIANNYFWKWALEVPPWGTPAYNAAVVTIAGIPMPGMIYPVVMVNAYCDSPGALWRQAALFRMVRRAALSRSLTCRMNAVRMWLGVRKQRRSIRWATRKYMARTREVLKHVQ